MAVTPIRASTPNSHFRDSGFLFSDDDIPFQNPFLNRQPVLLVNEHKLRVSLIKEWMAKCLNSHQSTCNSNHARRRLRTVVDFKLIDCKNRTLISAPLGCEYVALSYVWGSVKCGPENGKLPDWTRIPRTIQDSITLTLQLGYQYLWVDRYCISHDKNKKHAQIQQMNLIYSHAELSIFAAAGLDPSYGLPGVSRPRLSWCQQVNDLLSFPDALTILKQTKWWTRAWAYQEAILSKRRLIITDYQAYFECCQLQFYEALDSPPCKVTPGLQLGTCTCCHSAIFTLADVIPRSLGAWRLIVEYTNRHLTHPEDILDGISGIFREFQEKHEPFYFLWGTPISGRASAYDLGPATATELNNRFATALCFCHAEPQERRPNFPSWDWTGWYGAVAGWVRPVDCQGWLPVMVHDIPEFPITFSIDDGSCERELPEYLVTSNPSAMTNLTPLRLRPTPSIVHINASCVAISLHYFQAQFSLASSASKFHHEVWARIRITPDYYILVPVNLTSQALLRCDHFPSAIDGIVLGSISKDVNCEFPPTAIMITQNMRSRSNASASASESVSESECESVSERIGLAVISYPLPYWRNDSGPLGMLGIGGSAGNGGDGDSGGAVVDRWISFRAFGQVGMEGEEEAVGDRSCGCINSIREIATVRKDIQLG